MGSLFNGSEHATGLALHVLASGSRGNASVIVDNATGKAVVIDCGICKRDFFVRCEEAGVALDDIEGILITHEHTDHTKGLGVVLRGMAKRGSVPPVFVSDAVHAASEQIMAIDSAFDIRTLPTADGFTLGGMDVFAFATSHDAAESFGFRIEGSRGDALGYLTDSGLVSDAALAHLRRCRILALESNHDTRMLEEGPYPYPVKRRVASDRGHLSNAQSAEVLEEVLCGELAHVVAMHVSENNNTYRMPAETLTSILAQNGHGAQVQVAYQRMGVSVR